MIVAHLFITNQNSDLINNPINNLLFLLQESAWLKNIFTFITQHLSPVSCGPAPSAADQPTGESDLKQLRQNRTEPDGTEEGSWVLDPGAWILEPGSGSHGGVQSQNVFIVSVNRLNSVFGESDLGP